MSIYFLTIADAEIDWEKQQGLQVPPLAQWANCLIVLILFNSLCIIAAGLDCNTINAALWEEISLFFLHQQFYSFSYGESKI